MAGQWRIVAAFAASVCGIGLPQLQALAYTNITTDPCAQVPSAQQAYQAPNLHTVDLNASVQCPADKPTGPTDPTVKSNTMSRTTPPPTPPKPGDSCTRQWWAPVTFGPVKVGFSFPDWQPPPGGPGNSDVLLPGEILAQDRATILPTPPPGVEDLRDALGIAGASHVWIVYVGQHFTWQPAPGSPGTMVCEQNPADIYSYWTDEFRGKCPSAKIATGPNGTGDWEPCLFTKPAIVLPATPPPDPTALPGVAPLMQQQLQALTHGGSIQSAPSDKAYVNVPSCFWLGGADTSTTTYEMRLDDPADDGEGRHIVYTYRLNVGYTGTTWDYGDGTVVQGDAGHPWAGPGDACSNPHAYTRISTLGTPGATRCPPTYPHVAADDGCFTATAVSHYSVSGEVYWWDTNGPHHQPLSLTGLQGFDLPGPGQPPNTEAVQVFQIEGIPVSP